MTTQEIINDSKQYSLFTWAAQRNLNPIVVDRADGVYLYEPDGKRIIDFSSGLMSVNIGHGDQRVTEAVVAQMQKVSYVTPSCTTEIRAKLAKKIAQICPGNLNKSFFTLCGATAIDNAIKLARLYTGKHKIFGRYRGFHGASYASMTAGGDPRKLYSDAQQVPNIFHLDDPYDFYGLADQDNETKLKWSLDAVERTIKYQGPHTIAAFLFEGESGSSGCLHYPEGYLKGIKKLCEKYEILFIADEVMSGFGRTGKWFGFEHSDIIPDMICMAKGLTSSYLPLGCLTVTDTIAAKFDDQTLWLGLTYNSHPVAMAAALAVINIYETDNLIENTNKMGIYLENQIQKLRQKHPSVGQFRNKGLLGCLDVVKSKNPYQLMAPFNATPPEMTVMNQIAAKLRELGLYTFVRWGYIFIAPPMTITEAQIDEGLEIISQALSIADQNQV